jgi:hypothetical protein
MGYSATQAWGPQFPELLGHMSSLKYLRINPLITVPSTWLTLAEERDLKEGTCVYKSSDDYIFPVVTEIGENAFSLTFLLSPSNSLSC